MKGCYGAKRAVTMMPSMSMFAALLPITVVSYDVAVADLFGFCNATQGLHELNLSMASMYGTPVCAGDDDRGFVSAKDAPARFCFHPERRHELVLAGGRKAKVSQRLRFDQFALERVLLARWLETSAVCDLSVAGSCHADVLVVPSSFLHCELARGFTLSGALLLDSVAIKQFWDHVRTAVAHHPRVKLVVLHMPFVVTLHLAVLRVLAEQQPVAFRRRVLITSIGTHVFLPLQWSRGLNAAPADQLRARYKPASAHSRWVKTISKAPMLLPLPYPTGLYSPPVDWLTPQGTYAAAVRPILLMVDVGLRARHPVAQRIDILAALAQAGARCTTAGRCRICRRGYEAACMAHDAMWRNLVRSTFCAEPAGDTPDRSEFYSAALAGCIPVLFNGLNERFQKRLPSGEYEPPARLAWRAEHPSARSTDNELIRRLSGTPADRYPGLLEDYSQFSVTIDLETEGMAASNGSWVRSVVAMQPTRVHDLRIGLRRVAQAMTYRTSEPRACSQTAARRRGRAGRDVKTGGGLFDGNVPGDAMPVSPCAADERDGFARLRTFVSATLGSLRALDMREAARAGRRRSPRLS